MADVMDILAIGAVAVGAYFIWQLFSKGDTTTNETTTQTQSGTGNIQTADTQKGGAFAVNIFGDNESKKSSSNKDIPKTTTSKVLDTGSTQIFQTPRGESSVYNVQAGTLDFRGQGYSTAFPETMTKQLSEVAGGIFKTPAQQFGF